MLCTSHENLPDGVSDASVHVPILCITLRLNSPGINKGMITKAWLQMVAHNVRLNYTK